MSFYCPKKYETALLNVNEELLKLKGELPDKEAKITLAKFLRANIGFTVELLSDIKLAPYQEITLKALLNRNFNLCVWGRGCSKSFIAAVFIFISMIFTPGTKILIAGCTFRTARNIFTELEKMVKNPKAQLLAQIFQDDLKSRKNDLYSWSLSNGSSVVAIPLGSAGGSVGSRVRGFRAHILILDEFLLLSEEVIKTILMPFLAATDNIKEKMEVKELEDEMIVAGKMQEHERTEFPNNTKMICLSSASYTFENLYKVYTEWINKITDDKIPVGDARYFVSQMGYEAIPPEMLSKTIIEEAQNGGQSHQSFFREYCAQFLDDSAGYFSAKKMLDCAIKDGDSPHLELVGDKKADYILAIDPSFSNSPTSDNFAMCVMKIDGETGRGTVVHQYAVAGGDLKDHIDYFYYLTKCFNFKLIILDNAGGGEFIEAVNLSKNFLEGNIEYASFEWNGDKEGQEYIDMVKEAKRQYNLTSRKICIEQVFASTFIRKANELLQANIDHKRVWFGSKINPTANIFDKVSESKVPLQYIKGAESIGDLMDTQDILIEMVRKECSLIEVGTTAKGTQSFDLPQSLKRLKSISRPRKDNYSALLLANWGCQILRDLNAAPKQAVSQTFAPRVIR